MKKFLLAAALGMMIANVNAQALKESEVPDYAKRVFITQHQKAKDVKWEKEKGNYEASYKDDTGAGSVLLDSAGNVLQTERVMEITDLPQAALDYMKKNAKGEKIKEASKIIDNTGKTFWEAGTIGMDYIFDGKGNFIRTEKD